MKKKPPGYKKKIERKEDLRANDKIKQLIQRMKDNPENFMMFDDTGDEITDYPLLKEKDSSKDYED